jgi:CRP-like cAMP-binding protein
MHERQFAKGERMTEEGARGVGFFVILEGTASVDVGGEARRSLSPGDHFGEIALLDEGPRTASIVAESDVRAAGLTAWQFRPFVQEHADVAWALLQALARRLREAELH